MKHIFSALLLILSTSTASAQLLGAPDSPTKLVIEKSMRFCEGTTVYGNQILVSNFGTETCNPLNSEGKGYVLSVNMNGKVKTLIPADGSLSAPKGMVVVGRQLFIADVGKVVVYTLNQPKSAPQVITFSEEDSFVNDLVAIEDMIFVSVTNTGRIYAISAKTPDNLTGQVPQLIGHVPGANGMAVYGTNLYVASYNPKGVSTEENVIYSFNLSSTENSMSKLINDLKPGQYDGIVISEDGLILYFSSWGDGTAESLPAIHSYKLDGQTKPRVVDFGVDFEGPADISIRRGYLWVPDLIQSKLYRLPL